MEPDPAGPDERPPRLGRAIVGAFSTYLEWAIPFVAANAIWLLLIVIFGFVAVSIPVAWILTPILALPTAALMRLAVTAARAGVPSLRLARDELARLAGRKLLVAVVPLLLVGIGITNLRLAADMGGVPGLLSAAVAAYAVIGAGLLATALWPIVCDPLRDAPLRGQFRLALGVVVRRPLQLFALALIAGLAAVVSLQLIVPALFLPSLVLLAVAGYVVPAADELVPPSA